MERISELAANKYRDLKYLTGAEPAANTTKATTAPPQLGGFLMPISKDPLTQALIEGRVMDGVVLGIASSPERAPTHPIDRLHSHKGQTVGNGLAAGAGACFASCCDCV